MDYLECNIDTDATVTSMDFESKNTNNVMFIDIYM